MNKVRLELNSYTQKVLIFLNGQETSIYSELKNYTYKQIIHNPEMILNAIGKELNDDFDLFVTAPAYFYDRLTAAAQNNDYCNSCVAVAPKFALTTAERFNLLGNVTQPTELLVLLTNAPAVPETVSYCPITVSFTTDMDVDVDYQINFVSVVDVPPSGKSYVNIPVTDPQYLTADKIVSICEAYFIDPYLGKIVKNNATNKEIAVLASLQPVVEVIVPGQIEVGVMCEVLFKPYPEGSNLPSITLKSHNPDILAVEGNSLKGLSSGAAEIEATFAGENEPFFVKKISVEKTVSVSRIEIIGLENSLHEGKTIDLKAALYPHDADDIDSLEFTSSDPSIAKVIDGKLMLVGSGKFTLSAKTTHASISYDYVVLQRATGISISRKEMDTPVGGRVPISVTVTPENAYNAGHIWNTSDKTVAIVIKEEEGEFVKAVGIGECILTCFSDDKSVSDICSVNVKSMLYAKKKATRSVSTTANQSVSKGTSSTKVDKNGIKDTKKVGMIASIAIIVVLLGIIVFLVSRPNDNGPSNSNYVEEEMNIKNSEVDSYEDTYIEEYEIKDTETNSDSEYIISDSDERYLTNKDIEGMTKKQLNYAKNEIFARHGRRFNSTELQEYFNEQPWYVPKYNPEEFDETYMDILFNDYERKNVIFLKEKEDALIN